MSDSTPRPTSASGPRIKSPTVLIVDDNEDNRAVYAVSLAMQGMSVLEAGDGAGGIAMALAHLPNVIVMDLSMPGMDGWEASRRLKADERTRHIPILCVTANMLEGAEARAREAGCDGFLSKPCLPDTLFAALAALLGARAEEGATG